MSLPLPLVIRLLSLFLGSEGVTVYEGRLPDALAGLPLPESTQVAVSYVRRANKEDFLAGVALDTSLTPEAFVTQMASLLERSGWKQVRLPPPSIEPLLFESFSSSPHEMPEEPPFEETPFFTKVNLSLTLEYPSAEPGRLTHAYLQVGRTVDLPPPEPTSGLLFDILPQLTAPEGGELGGGTSFGGDDFANGSTTVTTNLSPGQLTEHFASQLEAAHWRVTERLVGARAALVVLERRDGKRTYDAQLMVFGSVAETYSVKLEALLRPND